MGTRYRTRSVQTEKPGSENIVPGLVMGNTGCAGLHSGRWRLIPGISRHFVRLPARAAEAVAKSRALAYVFRCGGLLACRLPSLRMRV